MKPRSEPLCLSEQFALRAFELATGIQGAIGFAASGFYAGRRQRTLLIVRSGIAQAADRTTSLLSHAVGQSSH